MEGRPPEVVDTVSGESLKLACMACIRGHRTKHCGGHNCRDKILWTIKRPGRPSNSCMCKFSGTGRCKCVLAKAQCPHKPKKGEKKTVDCRCDERGRLCCTLDSSQWEMISRTQKPVVRLYRSLEELTAGFSNGMPPPPNFASPGLYSQGQSPMSVPRTPGTSSVGGFTNGSGRSTPQTPLSVLHHPVGSAQVLPGPQPSAVPPKTRFGMMGIGAPMGSESHVGHDVLSWQGHTPIAPAPKPLYATPQPYTPEPNGIPSAFPTALDPSLSTVPYTFDNPMSQPPVFSPQHTPASFQSHPQTPIYEPPPHQVPSQFTLNTLPPVTASLSDLSVAPSGTLPAMSAFDTDYFNFQFPGAICQQCGMADCTCRSCPTVLQSTSDGSWRQCCSRKHVHFGAPAAVVQAGTSAKKGCCGSKGIAGASALAPNTAVQPAVMSPVAGSAAPVANVSDAGGCCGGSSSNADFEMDPFDFNIDPLPNGHQHQHNPFPSTEVPHTPLFAAPESNGFVFDPAAPLPHTRPPDQQQHFAGTAVSNAHPNLGHEPIPEWTNPGDIDMDFDEFIQELGDEMGCGCGTDCPCGMEQDDGLALDDSFEMDLDADPGGGQEGEEGGVGGGGGESGGAATPARKGCCGS